VKKPKMEEEKTNKSAVPAEALAQIERASKKEMEKNSTNTNKGGGKLKLFVDSKPKDTF
jgi:hypothetical protein